MKALIIQTFNFLIELGFQLNESKKGKEQILIYSKEDSALQISWTSNDQKPSLTYSDEAHLWGILDCEKQIRNKHKNLPENQQELLAWIFSVMTTQEFLETFAKKIKTIHG